MSRSHEPSPIGTGPAAEISASHADARGNAPSIAQAGAHAIAPAHGATGAALALALLRLARPHQWSKGAFVLVGGLYGGVIASMLLPLGLAFVAFALASSACYVVNDIRDRHADGSHPRKRRRPIASGAVSVSTGSIFAAALLIGAAGCVALLAALGPSVGVAHDATGVAIRQVPAWLSATLVGAALAVYVANTMLYSFVLKHLVIVDVMSLALGFVLRVLGGCAAALVMPSTYLLNVTLFLAMFLAFGKRLGERRTLGEGASAARGVQAGYTDELLRMVVVVTAVACLVTYAGYVQTQGQRYTYGFNLLWLTMIPATYGLLRAILLVESGRYDDPTELATHDRPFQLSAACFGLLTVALMAAMPATIAGAGGAAAGGAVDGGGTMGLHVP